MVELAALSDVSANNALNINILTHLEMERVKVLFNNGKEFSEAKSMAQSEIMDIFGFSETIPVVSEQLDIFGEGNENAILLAISIICQGFGDAAELSALLFDLTNDIKDDGKLDDPILGSTLIGNAKYLNLENIRDNLESRYPSASIPNFEKYIQLFIDSTKFELTNIIRYPKNGLVGPNILSDSSTINKPGRYSIAAIVPKGTTLKITYGPAAMSSWQTGTEILSEEGWSVKDDFYPIYHEIKAIGNGKPIDNLAINLWETSAIEIKYYEYGSSKPTKTRLIAW